ncbi:MAG: MFS transporter [Deltaproteobacteria bacterium]|nr:MFS transporter [Deltaproteobacteria bacterium]MBW2051931.1 MFS transporter [Deltaproteobacteria bacterium]MBW2140338.1 MFS transporter [Deltaproteobacteria bacterium]MBW2323567.1 MFS transporter [Deltaproteobacteria bacterium]
MKRSALIIASLAAFLPPFMGASINIALPTIGKLFEMDAIMLGWVATSYLLSSAMFLLPFGRAADIYGRKKVFTFGISLYMIGAALSAVATNASMLIIFRVVQGIGSAGIFGTGVAILTSVYPPQERGKALGINVASVYTGLSLGPFLGGLLTQYLGWRSIFYINIPFGLLILFLIFYRLKGEWAEAKGEKIDLPGSVIYSLALVLIMYGLSRLPASAGVWLLVCGGAVAIVFFWWEVRSESPVLNVNIFRNNAVFTFSNLAALIHYSATFAVGFLLSLYLQYSKGLSAKNAGLILIFQPVIMALFSPIAGRISDRIEPRVVASLGMTCSCIGLFLLAFISAETSLAYIAAVLIFNGFGFALFSSPNTNAVMSSVEKRFYGVAASMLGTMRLVGMMLSMGVAMMIFAIFIGKTQITPELYPMFLKSAKIAFVIFGVLCVFGIFSSLARGKVR